MIDGVDIKNYSHQALHRLITIVQQEPVLFARSIKENILYGELNIKEEEEEHEIDVAVTKGMHSMVTRKSEWGSFFGTITLPNPEISYIQCVTYSI